MKTNFEPRLFYNTGTILGAGASGTTDVKAQTQSGNDSETTGTAAKVAENNHYFIKTGLINLLKKRFNIPDKSFKNLNDMELKIAEDYKDTIIKFADRHGIGYDHAKSLFQGIEKTSIVKLFNTEIAIFRELKVEGTYAAMEIERSSSINVNDIAVSERFLELMQEWLGLSKEEVKNFNMVREGVNKYYLDILPEAYELYELKSKDEIEGYHKLLITISEKARDIAKKVIEGSKVDDAFKAHFLKIEKEKEEKKKTQKEEKEKQKLAGSNGQQ